MRIYIYNHQFIYCETCQIITFNILIKTLFFEGSYYVFKIKFARYLCSSTLYVILKSLWPMFFQQSREMSISGTTNLSVPSSKEIKANRDDDGTFDLKVWTLFFLFVNHSEYTETEGESST